MKLTFLRFPRVIAASTLVIVGVIINVSQSSPNSADATSMTVPICKAGQIQELLRPLKVTKNAQASYKASVVFTNTGGYCAMSTVQIGLVALSGSSVLAASVILTDFTVGHIYLSTHQSAQAQIVVDRTGGAAFGKGCNPKAANKMEVLPLYHGWPKKLFLVTPKVLICTGGDINFVGSNLLKTPQSR